MTAQIGMPERLRNHLARMVGQEIDGFRVKEIIGSGNTAVTYGAVDRDYMPWALKVVTRDSYGARAPFREIARFAQTKDERFLVFPKRVGDWRLRLDTTLYEFVWFASRRVDGHTLQHFLRSDTQFSAKTEILRYMENLAVALEELERLGFHHGDLHDRNIMREVVGEGGTSPEVRYVVIDFSEAHPIAAPQEGISKDLECFGRHLRSFYDALKRRQDVTREDERVLSAITHIPGLVNGTSAESMAISKPQHVLARFREALECSHETPRKLRTPFESLSAENIANDALLADLCFTQMWWTPEIEKNTNLLLVGPRGCGKTMIFRRLRLKTKIAANKFSEIESDPYVAFYLPCESLFYMRFSDLSNADVFTNKDGLVLFFNMAVLAEVSSTLSLWPSSISTIPRSLAVAMSEHLREEIGELWNDLGFPSSLATFEEVTSCAEHVMRHIRRSIANAKVLVQRGSAAFVARLVEIVKRDAIVFSNRYLMFFLDDYTAERVPIVLQEALHPIVCQRSADLCFKISAHMFGSIYSSPRPLALDEGRNIEVVNLGAAYLKRNTRRAEGKLLLRILNERFKHCDGYHGTIQKWLGTTSFPGGRTLSWALHDRSTRPKVRYHGVECLMQLCTGDYSEMIRMVGEIFREGGIRPGSDVQRIDPRVQSRAIERVSQEYLSRVRHIRPDGGKLFSVVNSFGKLSKQMLYEHPLVGQGTDSKGRPRKEPYDLLDIYVDDFTRASGDAQEIWRRLQKASILVDIGIAASQRSAVADRATLRRIYCPAFKTTYTSSERLQLMKDQFEYFVDKPEEFCRSFLSRELLSKEQPGFWDEHAPEKPEAPVEEFQVLPKLPERKLERDFGRDAPRGWVETVAGLPEPTRLDTLKSERSTFDLYIGAFGFEDRTTAAIQRLVRRGVHADSAIMFDYDLYFPENEERRPAYERLLAELTSGKPYRPLLAAVGSADPAFTMRLASRTKTVGKAEKMQVLFDVSSVPALILAQTLRVLLGERCSLILLYSEAEEYFPTRAEWEASRDKPFDKWVVGPFAGVRYVAAPRVLQADDAGELPVSLILLPTANTERTNGVLAELDPADRVWIFGAPHDMERNAYRIEMAKSYAAPIMHLGDSWSVVDTFDYRRTLLALGGIYAQRRFSHRMVAMPHGSKMQSLGVSLFAAAHEVSLVFATPQEYNPQRYSRGCREVWAIPLGDTRDLAQAIRSGRVLSGQHSS